MANLKGGTTVGGFKVWHRGNMGSGSGLDADLLDGLDSSQFLRSDQGGSVQGDLTIWKDNSATTLQIGKSNTGVGPHRIIFGEDGSTVGQVQIAYRTALDSIQFERDGETDSSQYFLRVRSNGELTAAGGSTIWHRDNFTLSGANVLGTSHTWTGPQTFNNITINGTATIAGLFRANGGISVGDNDGRNIWASDSNAIVNGFSYGGKMYFGFDTLSNNALLSAGAVHTNDHMQTEKAYLFGTKETEADAGMHYDSASNCIKFTFVRN